MSTLTTPPIARTPWVETVHPSSGLPQSVLSTPLLTLEVDALVTGRTSICVLKARYHILEHKEVADMTRDAAKAEAVRMALRHLAAAIISL